MNLTPSFALTVFASLAFCCVETRADEPDAKGTATLKMRFAYDGEPPKVKTFNAGGNRIRSESLLVDAKSRGIANVVVWLYTGRGGTEIQVPPGEPQQHQLTVANGQFAPHVLMARAGDSIRWVNQGPAGIAPSFSCFKNKNFVIAVPPIGIGTIKLPLAEPAPIPVDDQVYPWRRAYVVVNDTPFFACSDTTGNVEIKGLPVGTELVFRAWHEELRIGNVTMGNSTKEWKRSRFNVTLKPSVNDLGDVLIANEPHASPRE